MLTAATGSAVQPESLPADVAAAAILASAAAVPPLVAGAIWQARRAARTIGDIDAAGGTVTDAVAALGDHAADMTDWAKLAAADAAGSATEVGRAVAAEHVAKTTDGVEIQRQWLSRKDARVRPTHTVAHGQRRDLGKKFAVGQAQLRYPRDPLGPPGEIRNCRCHTVYRQRKTGQFTAVAGVARAAS
jgi:hypothetical protein